MVIHDHVIIIFCVIDIHVTVLQVHGIIVFAIITHSNMQLTVIHKHEIIVSCITVFIVMSEIIVSILEWYR